MKQKLSLGIF